MKFFSSSKYLTTVNLIWHVASINILITLFLLFYAIQETLAQTSEQEFTQITVIDRLRLGKINAIAQDKNGFLWLSDQGNRAMLRYDGKHVKKYQYDQDKPNQFGGFYPECFFIEESGIIWIGFYGQGLDRFDQNANTFTHFRHDPQDPNSLRSDFVTGIIEDNHKNLWIATYSGLDMLDRKTGEFTNYHFEAGNSKSLSCDTIRSLYLDKQGTLWVGTGMAWIENARGGLNRFNPETKDFNRFMHDPEDPSTLINNKVRSIFEDSRGNFWIGTGGDGLHTMDRKTGKVTRHTYDPANPEKLSRSPLGAVDDRITFIREDPVGNIWIGTNNNGVNMYDPFTEKVRHFTEEFNGGAWWMHVTKDDQIWISTNWAQLVRIDPCKYRVQSNPGRMDFIVKETEEISWIGNNDGLTRINKMTGEKMIFRHDPADENSLTSNRITTLLLDSKGMLWIGTWEGLNLLDPKTGLIKRFRDGRGDSSTIIGDGVTIIMEDSHSNIWIGTGPGALNRFDRKKEEFTHYQHDFTNSQSLSGYIVANLEEASNSIWVALAANGGLNKLNAESGVFDLYLHGLNVFEIYCDSKGVLWAATEGGGLFRYDPVADVFVSAGINGDVISIHEDDASNLWLSTMSGVYRINPQRDHITFFESVFEIGDSSFYENIGVSYVRDGQVHLGHWSGYFVFNPVSLEGQKDSTVVFVSEIISLDGKVENGTLYQYAPGINNVSFDQDQNSFSVFLSETDFRFNVDNDIYFMLENYDLDWRKATPGESINYFKVPTGSYILKMKATSSSGLWTKNEFIIKVLPPWWQTNWAYAGYGIIFIFGVLAIHRIQKSKTIRKERERAKDRELEQAREIEKAYNELKATQSLLIQSEKMASLGELTAGIAHEIQNPLNFVNNFSEVNAELIDELEQEINSGNFEDVKSIAKDIKQNEEKIKYHGKRAETIVKSMLHHSRTSNGQKELTDLNALADEYIRLAYHGMRAKDKSFNADFKTEFDKSLPKVNVIHQDIGRVLLNLINNAFYAVDKMAARHAELIEESGAADDRTAKDDYRPEVVVSTRKLDNHIEICVKDNGHGIPDHIKDKIFQPFFTTKPTGQGTGLGLSLSYDIMKAHGGDLKVVSNEGDGSEFTLTFNTD